MSRIGNKPVEVPKNVNVNIASGNIVEIKGPKGVLVQSVHPNIKVEVKDNILSCSRATEQEKDKAMHGLYRMLLHNMVVGVTKGCKKSLQLIGIGYKATVADNILELSLGKSHIICMKIPEEIIVQVEITRGRNPLIYLHIEGIDKYLVGQIAARIRDEKKPEAYTSKRGGAQKGIRYVGELLIGKAKKNSK